MFFFYTMLNAIKNNTKISTDLQRNNLLYFFLEIHVTCLNF